MRSIFLILLACGACLAQNADEVDYAKRWKHLSNETAKEHRMAARFCRERKLWAAARSEWVRALELEPGNDEAKKAVAEPEQPNAGTPKEIEAALAIYRKKRAALDGAAARDFAELADWCGRRGLEAEESALLKHLHSYDPQDAAAAEAAGWVKDGDAWVPKAEAEARQAARARLRAASAGKEAEGPSEATKDGGFKFARRATENVSIEGKWSQEELAEFVRTAEAARSLFCEVFALADDEKPPPMTAVFLTSQEDHVRFLEKCTPLTDDERAVWKTLGGWSRFDPIVFEIWTRGPLPQYHREAACHVAVHMMFQKRFGIEEPPGWVQEGLALWFADLLCESALVRCTDLKSNETGDDRSLSTRGWRREVAVRLREGTDPPIRQVLSARYDELDHAKMVKSWSLVEFMLDGRREAFRAFVTRLGKGESQAEALYDSLKLDGPDALQSLWEERVRETS